MTGKERILKTLGGGKTDRVLIAPFIYYNNIYELFDYVPDMDNFFDPDDFDPIEKFVEYCKHYGFDIIHSLGSVWDFYVADSSIDKSVLRAWDNWDVTITDQRKEDEIFRTVTIHTPEGTLTHAEKTVRASRYLIVSAIQEYLLKTQDDFEIFRKYAPPSDFMDCSLVRRAKSAVGDKGIVCCSMDGAFNTPARHFMDFQNFMTLPFVDEGFYREMLDFFLSRITARVLKLAGNGVDVFEVAGNLAGSDVGKNYFKQYVQEYERKLIREIHDAGALVIYHNCGRSMELLSMYNEMEIDCLGYLTPPPFGDFNLDKALSIVRPDMALRGNIDQVDFLKTASPGEIGEKIKVLLDKVKHRGNWILSTTDFMFDGVPRENIEAFAKAGTEYGRYE